MSKQTYLIALGSNFPNPKQRVARAAHRLGLDPLSRIITSAPIGPNQRNYANAVGLLKTDLAPPQLLQMLKTIERDAGRRPGQHWGARPLDLDIIGWDGGNWASQTLIIPHPEFRKRRFVLAPLVDIAPTWRDPITYFTARQLLSRLDRKRPAT